MSTQLSRIIGAAVTAIFLSAGLGFSGHAHARQAPLFVSAAHHTEIENIEGCKEEELYRNKPKKFSDCTDPEKLFSAAKNFALAADLPLVILWGFDSCPACQLFHDEYFDPDMLPSDKAITGTLTPQQRTEFDNYTKKGNQLAIVRMSSRTDFSHNHDFAERIGANAIAKKLGNKRV